MNYYISKTITATNFEAAKAKVTEALQSEGFGVLTEIDIQATMKKKLDKDYRPFLILGACNPVYADKVLSLDPRMSVMLPCNVVLRSIDDQTIEVAAIDPLAAMGGLGNTEIEPLAADVKEKLARVIEKIF
ncbi:DUF302 domain-containing protein [Mongoliitalea daihaiensis]|uniref:DUF302 domain-containing protein n=1 Tax=Mongoliitalea daihaiensis TaxID=2782006 RepID=UPI001F3B7A9D|nr:DUF302 domain-containing protein [Mongoliitalea daihaiensis]UJP65057.1 DUF302 domain-containing protein [Mongoliitalea daihaiensis]